MKATNISVIIVTYNSENIIKECILSFIKYLGNYIEEIIIVDNSENDKTIKKIQEIGDKRIKIIKNNKNVGYRKAINIGMKYAKNDIVIVSNPDIFLIDDSLQEDINKIKEDTNIGIICPIPTTQQYFAFKPILPCILYKTISTTNLLEYKGKRFIKSYIGGGAIFIIRKKVFEEIGGLSEKCFMYGEEIELSYKISKKGYKIL